MKLGQRAGKRHRIFLIVCLLAIVFVPAISGADKYFPLDQVKPGLTGTGYTVFSGTKIEPFNVKVITVVDDGSVRGKLILVRLSGKRIEECGGLAAGMSGSPVYIKGRLLGAISYGFENADPTLAMVTPIESMLMLFNNRYYGFSRNDAPHRIPVGSPVMVSGMGSRGFELVHRALVKAGLPVVLNIGSQSQTAGKTAPDLQPGSAIAVQMVKGDYQVAAIGTVTLVDGNRFLAFGHQFSNKGDADYLAYQATIFQTVKSSVMSFKMGSAVQLIGRIVQDRQAGIAGRLGELPQLVSVKVTVRDRDRSKITNYNFDVVNNDSVITDLVVSGVTDAVDKAIDRIGPGTAKVNLSIETNSEPERISRDNIFFGKDIAAAASDDLREVLDILTGNEFKPVTIKKITVDIDVADKRQSARVYKLTADKTKVKPGAVLKVTASVRSFRGEDYTVPFDVKLPDNLQAGKLVLTIRGGAKGFLEDDDKTSKKSGFNPEDQQFNSLNETIRDFADSPKNNELILEYYPITGEESGNTEEKADNSVNKPIQIKSATPDYLTGQADLTIEVEN